MVYEYLLTAIGLPPGGSCTVHIYTQTIHRTTQNKQYIEQHKKFENNAKIWKRLYFVYSSQNLIHVIKWRRPRCEWNGDIKIDVT
jgi:hypothetical protein